MKTSLLKVLALLFCSMAVANAAPVGSAFTYQGVLNDGGNPASGSYDLRFTLYDAASGGSQIGTALTNPAVAVNEGLFSVTLDFGASAFPGANRWLAIGVRTNGSAADFTALVTRQAINTTPYAIMAGDITSANVARLDVPNTAMQATGVPIVTSGFITDATVTSGGSGYITPPPVTVNDTTGSGAVLSATLSDGVVIGLNVHNAGSGYSSEASLTIAPPPSNAYQVFASTNFFSGVNALTNSATCSPGVAAASPSLMPRNWRAARCQADD